MLSQIERAAFQRNAPRSIEETGISQGLILDLLLRQAFFEGIVTLGKLAERSKLSPTIIHWVYRYLLKEQLCETRAMVGDDYEISLTSRGRSMAEVALRKGQYSGPAPVSLKDYNESVSAQAIHVSVTAASMRSRGQPRFSSPKATSAATCGMTSWLSGSWKTSPTVCPRTPGGVCATSR